MERAVVTSRKTVLVLTPAYLDERLGRVRGADAADARPGQPPAPADPAPQGRSASSPLRIGYLTYVNFADPDDPAWPWTQLLTALGAAPIQEPPPAPERPGWFLPHPYGAQPNFTGRAAERQMLSDWLANDGEHPLLVAARPGRLRQERAGLALAASRRGRGPLAPRGLVELLRGGQPVRQLPAGDAGVSVGPVGAGRFRSERQRTSTWAAWAPPAGRRCCWTSCASPAPC